MTELICTRRDSLLRVAKILPAVGLAGAGLATVSRGSTRRSSAAAGAVTVDTISHTAEAIHQEIRLKASPARVYRALTEAAQFDKLVVLSGITPKESPTQITPEVGSAFSLFNGHIIGRNVELVPNQRIIQAWQATSWKAGAYSIASFELSADGEGTEIIFDHAGFPTGLAQSLADGWKEHYRDTLEKYLA